MNKVPNQKVHHVYLIQTLCPQSGRLIKVSRIMALSKLECSFLKPLSELSVIWYELK